MKNLTPENTALLVVDMQDGESWKFNTHHWNRIVESIGTLTTVARAVRMPIIHVFYSTKLPKHIGPFEYDENIDPFVFKDTNGDTKNIWSSEHIVGDCFPKIGEWMYGKNSRNAFEEGNFLSGLKGEKGDQLQNILVSGVMLNDCVLKTAKGGQEHGYRSIVIPEATGRTIGAEAEWLEENSEGISIIGVSDIIKHIGMTRADIRKTLVQSVLEVRPLPDRLSHTHPPKARRSVTP